ncbi:MAG: hypothetical protein Q8R30_04155 [bacterium]|nr:hypothetical protein [bacterium]
MKKKITIDDLALMVKHGFDQTATKKDLEEGLAQLRTELRTEMQDGFRGVNRRIDLLHEDISDLPDIREELKDHDKRLVRVERKVAPAK